MLASKVFTPYCAPSASMVLPLPRLIATCWCTVALPPLGSLLNEKSRAPGVWMASCTEIVMPRSCSCWYWCQALRSRFTPAWCADHWTSIEQSNALGFGSSRLSETPKMYRSPFCAIAALRNVCRWSASAAGTAGWTVVAGPSSGSSGMPSGAPDRSSMAIPKSAPGTVLGSCAPPTTTVALPSTWVSGCVAGAFPPCGSPGDSGCPYPMVPVHTPRLGPSPYATAACCASSLKRRYRAPRPPCVVVHGDTSAPSCEARYAACAFCAGSHRSKRPARSGWACALICHSPWLSSPTVACDRLSPPDSARAIAVMVAD